MPLPEYLARREEVPRPPTPYPFSTAPSWEAPETLRGGCPPAYAKRFKEPVPSQNRIIYRHIVGHDFDHHGAAARPKTDDRTRPAERRRSAVDNTDDSDVQRRIRAHNARIAQRPHSASSHKKVRFRLPHHRESRRSETELAERLERLRVEDHRSGSTRCRSCGRRLSCRKCGPASPDIK